MKPIHTALHIADEWLIHDTRIDRVRGAGTVDRIDEVSGVAAA